MWALSLMCNVKKLNSILEQAVLYLGGSIHSTDKALSILSNNRRIVELLMRHFCNKICWSTSNMGLCVNGIRMQERHSRYWQQAHNQVVSSWKRKTDFRWTLHSYHDLVKRDSNFRTNVLCKFETPRGCWLNGIVNQVYPGPDGLIRQVLVKTNSGLV